MSPVIPVFSFDPLQHRWRWLLAFGIAFIVLGLVALAFMPAATLASVLVLGWLMIAGGVVEAVYAFHTRGWGGMLLHLVGAVVGILVGLLVVTHPVAGALGWTLLFAVYLTVLGVFRIVAAGHLRYQSWGWALFDGIVTLVLGLLLWTAWPSSALWFFGFALGIALILHGWTMVMFAIAVRAFARALPLRRVA